MRVPICSAGLLLLLLGADQASAQDAKTFFDDNCSMCHSIGGEPLGGPDLKDITKRRDRDWLVRFILDPHEAAEHDPEARALVKEYDDLMPATEGASPDLMREILRYIDEMSGGAPAAAQAQTPSKPVTAADIAFGRELYEGKRRLTEGAPACLSCHELGAASGLGGGTLGPDLTGVHQKLGGTSGLTSWMRNPPTPVMRAIYRKARLNEQEAFALAAFLSDPAAAGSTAGRPSRGAFLMIGAAGVVLAFIVMGVAWSGRFRAARRPLVARARAQAGGER
jgi:cytochrome c2